MCTQEFTIGHWGYDLKIAGTTENVFWSEQVLEQGQGEQRAAVLHCAKELL